MAFLIIWMDQNEARLFALSEERMERITINGNSKIAQNPGQDYSEVSGSENHLFKKILPLISSTCFILILGPSLAKHNFQKYLREQKPHISRRVVGCETLVYPNDKDIAEVARKFFMIVESKKVMA